MEPIYTRSSDGTLVPQTETGFRLRGGPASPAGQTSRAVGGGEEMAAG